MVLLGVAIGFIAAAPVGPVNIMTMQRVLRHGFLAGVIAALGSVVADAMFAAAAAFGLSAVGDFFEGHARTIQVVGGVFLILFGLRIVLSHPHFNPDYVERKDGILSGMAGAFALTITNPGALFGFLALFSALGDWAPEPGDWLGAGELVLGVIGGSFFWWLMIAALVAKLRDHLDDHWLERVNWFAGGLLITFGLLILARLGLIVSGLL